MLSFHLINFIFTFAIFRWHIHFFPPSIGGLFPPPTGGGKNVKFKDVNEIVGKAGVSSYTGLLGPEQKGTLLYSTYIPLTSCSMYQAIAAALVILAD